MLGVSAAAAAAPIAGTNVNAMVSIASAAAERAGWRRAIKA
jgi:hypothetical protein